MLFANDYYEGYSLKAIHPSLAFLVRVVSLCPKVASLIISAFRLGRIPTRVCSLAGM
jgi:hypothetical protein